MKDSSRLGLTDEEILKRARDAYGKNQYEEAANLYSMLAEKGHVDSQVFMGWLYSEGVGLARDLERAKLWFEKAALSDSHEGMFYYGRFLTAQGDHAEAIRWYRRAAALGYAPAHFRMGEAYARGLGVSSDTGIAMEQYRKGAEQGHLFAKRAIALRELSGKDGWRKMPFGGLKFLFVVAYGLLLGIIARHSDRLKF